jgi:3-isopropylmalate/(R)-2-methylmalate dehydratase small subunit
MTVRQPRIEGIAAPLPRANVDTDQIIPIIHLISVTREGMGKGLFADWRYGPGGVEKPDFVLNRAPWRAATILVAGPNFGCGSSREHAVWALREFGIRAVIAPSFASIFHDNCFKNGLAPIIVAEAEAAALQGIAERNPHAPVIVDLEGGRVRAAEGFDAPFAMDKSRRRDLIEGLDEIGASLAKAEAIDAFRAADRLRRPWVYAHKRS